MEKVALVKRLERIGLVTVASLLMLGSGSTAFAQHSGGFHGGGGGFHGGGGGFHGGGGFRGFHGGGYGGYRGGGYGGYRGGYGYGYRGYGRGWGPGWGPGWGLGLGLYLSVLPWYYTTFWWSGVPYYYVQNDYYVWDSDADAYEQVQPPPQVAEEAQNGQQAQSGQPVQNGQVTEAPPQLYAYPKNGQTAQQQATDKRECGSWASAQTGLNPAPNATAPAQTAPGNGNASNAQPDQGNAAGNANTPGTAQQWQNYLRAESACLEARGYTVE